MGSTRAASHYRGAAGRRYFDYQREAGELGARLDLFKFEPHISPGDVVVDFGCGNGAMLASLHVKLRIGVEPNRAARDETWDRGIPCAESATELPDGTFDVAISNHALEHTLNPFEELRELRRALKPGGRLVLWLPLDDWRTQRRESPDPDHHLYAWTPRLLRNLLTEAGFDVRECRVVAHAWPPFAGLFWGLPGPVFGVVAWAWSVARRRRQVMAVAIR